jgi:acetoin:2,6-dichlorophenolindophenol oxidoreductase subunit alpha
MATYSKAFLADLYRLIYTIRELENRCIKLYRQGLIRGYFHPYLGEEAIAVGVCAALEARDTIVSTHRGHGHCIARGADLRRMIAELLGKAAGYCAGRGGSMHIADVKAGNLGANGIVGAGIPIGVGAALASSIRGDGAVTAIFFSDGASNNGVFAEAMNLAAIWNLPALFVLENNHYAVSTPIEKVCRTRDLRDRAQGYGVEGLVVDGNDVLDVYETSRDAIEKCRKGQGPVLIEAKTYRQAGHHVNDPGTYMPKDRLEHYLARDPLILARKHLADVGVSETDTVAIEAGVDRQLEDAVEFAKRSPEPEVEAFLSEVETY